MMGMPRGYTMPCVPKSQRKTEAHLDLRHTLVGNAWSIPVVAWLLGQLLGPLGFTDPFTPQQVMDCLDPRKVVDVRSKLLRAPLNPVVSSMSGTNNEASLGHLLTRLVSTKGDDILIIVELIRLLVINDSVKLFHRGCGNGRLCQGGNGSSQRNT